MKVSVFAPTVLKDDGKSDFFVQILFKEPIKGAMCNKVEYLLTEMQYDIHNYVFSGV